MTISRVPGAVFDSNTGCLLWIGTKSHDGYAVDAGKYVHVTRWVESNGPIPPGVELDHFCRRRNCIRRRHLDPVTRAENSRRKSAWYRRRLDRCPSGHALVGATRLHTPEGGLACAVCLHLED